MDLLTALIAAAKPHLMELLGVILTLALTAAADAARRAWGITIEAKHREALHSAILSGVSAAIDRGLSGPAAVDLAIAYAEASSPGAIRKLKPQKGVLGNLARAKLRQLTAN